MKKGILKKVLGITAIAIPIGLVIGFSNSWVQFPSVSVSGSSAMEPLLSILGDSYGDADVSVVAGGSGAGVKAAVLQEKDIGNSSANPYSRVQKATIAKDEYDLGMWNEKEMKTVTVAWDAIAIVYKPISNADTTLNLTNDNIAKLYEVFAGQNSYPINYLINGSTSSASWTPYARTGGAKASGTATSFLKESGFSNASTIPSNISKILDEGSYGKKTVQTAESNIESWTRIKSDNQPGSIIYLSLGFVSKNIAEITSSGFKVATYNGKDANKANIDSKQYLWFSPLNSIFSTKLAPKPVIDFMWWIFDSSESTKIIEDAGFIPLNSTYKETMFLKSDSKNVQNFLKANDYALYLQRKGTSNETWYGAPK